MSFKGRRDQLEGAFVIAVVATLLVMVTLLGIVVYFMGR